MIAQKSHQNTGNYTALSILSVFAVAIIFFFAMTKDFFLIVPFILIVLLILMTISSIRVHDGKKVKNPTLFLGLFILCLDLAFFYFCSIRFLPSIPLYLNGQTTEATIVSIEKTEKYETKYDDNGSKEVVDKSTCAHKISYIIDNETYSGQLSDLTCNKEVGDKVKIYYSTASPSNFEDTSPLMLIIITVAMIFILIVTIPFSIQLIAGKELKIFKKINKKLHLNI